MYTVRRLAWRGAGNIRSIGGLESMRSGRQSSRPTATMCADTMRDAPCSDCIMDNTEQTTMVLAYCHVILDLRANRSRPRTAYNHGTVL